MMATHGHHDGNPWPLPSGWQPLWPGALPLPHGGTLPHSLTGPRAGWGAGNVGGFLFATAWRSRNPRGEIFSTVSLHARFHQKLARREAFLKASLRVCRAQSASSQTLPAETCAKWPIIATWEGLQSHFAHVSSQNLREMASSATTARREARDKVTLRTRFHQKPAWREAFQKASLHTGFGFARLCQKGTFPHAPHFTPPRLAPPRTPHIARHTPRGRTGAPARRRTGTLAPRPCTAVVMATYCHHDGNPWHS